VVLECCKYLAGKHGFEITYLAVDAFGCVNPEDVKRAMRKDTVLVTGTYMHVQAGVHTCIESSLKVWMPNVIGSSLAVAHFEYVICTAN
jgi:cysteine sulfinate desulfinase/cysteine desulfurase-like protein